nr:uncharacterized protein LOC129269656 [Lytechinus pictus]
MRGKDKETSLFCWDAMPFEHYFLWREREGEFQMVKDCLDIETAGSAHVREVVTGATRVVLPARTIQQIQCAIRPFKVGEDAESSVWLIQGNSQFGDSQVEVIEGCCAENGDMHVLLMNSGDREFIVPPHSTIASAKQVEERCEICLQTKDDQLEVNICDILIAKTEPGVEGDGHEPEQAMDTKPPSRTASASQERFTFTDGAEILLPQGISLDGMAYEDASRIAKLLHDHEAAFSKDEFDLGCCDMVPHEIRVTSDKPVRLPYRRIAPHVTSEVRDLLQDMLERKIIKRSTSPYASPIVLVRKKSGALRYVLIIDN